MRAALTQAMLALSLVMPGCAACAVPDAARLAPGSGSFVFPFPGAGAARQVRVWYYRPDGAGPETPVVFVMHGTGRNGESYRGAWIPSAKKQRFALLVPEFSRAEFAKDYNLERLSGATGPIPQAQWPYQAIEEIFDAVRAANGLRAPTYDIYGHSAGGQFVHRLALLLPHARYRIAVAANAGWYTMPDFGVAYPYGLGGTNVPPEQLARVLGRRLVVLLGERDIDPDHRQLRRSSGANVQGEHRLARGLAFFERGRLAAQTLGTPFEWRLQIAPGVAHSNSGMAPLAATLVGGRD
jgi:pimeloyl-ACP methyl ester carboxylesterase